ncbi:putative Metal dependent phosphohydrolase [Candidatus Sulfopaludibacter sp. SbA3]|nr:putative Metal dependent phosphohydrolase [Candidatus Sulfopaludibacter sp. SbA3]
MATGDYFHDLDQLPQFPGIATKVLRVLSRDDTRVAEIAGLIRADAALSSELLRIVNSPLYGMTSRISSIQQALLFLGFDEIRRFVLAVSMKSFFRAAMRLDLLRGIWRHSLACAIVCEELSMACSAQEGRDDRAYTSGLLADIGRLGLFVLHPQEYSELLTSPAPDIDMLEQERMLLGVDHCEAGAWLAAKWRLPDEVQRVAATHHNRPDAPGFDLEKMGQVGVLLTGVLGFDVTPPQRVYTLQEIRALLPHAAQYRFDPDPVTMQARIADKLDAFD